MANVIKYSPGSTSINTIKLGSFAVGVNQGGYGLTSVTGFWNGKTPNVSGYTIYQANGASSPTLYAAANDSELITYSNQLGGSGNTTIGQALTYFRDDTNFTCLNVDVSNIVTSGLTIYLDAGIVSCYPKTGIFLNNLNGIAAGVIVNSASYNSTNNGGLYFSNGNNAYISTGYDTQIPTNPTQLTVICFINPNTPVSPPGVLFSYRNSITELIQLTIQNSTTAYFQVRGSSNTLLNVSLPITMGSNCMLAGIFNKTTGVHTLYVNTTSTTGSLNLSGQTLNSAEMFLCATYVPTLYYEGYLYSFQLYDRALSNAEILQNYYAGLQRFIPTNGLVLYLDGNNTNKQVMTASTANDISGNNYNGTLTNGVALARDGQRSFSFDGVDDYISLTGTISLGNTFTIISWIKLSVVGGTYNVYGCVANGSDNWFGVAGSVINFRGTEIADVNNFDLNGVTTLSVGVWYQIAVTVNVSTVTIYLNGVVENSVVKSFVIATWNSNGGNDIGRRGGINSNFFNGNIGQVRAYNTVLSTANILTIYTAGKQRYGL